MMQLNTLAPQVTAHSGHQCEATHQHISADCNIDYSLMLARILPLVTPYYTRIHIRPLPPGRTPHLAALELSMLITCLST